MDDLEKEFSRISEQLDTTKNLDSEVERLRSYQRKRHLACWHDTSAISNSSHLLIMIHVIYDPAIYLTKEEYHAKTGKYCNLFSIVNYYF
jgi:hypothetical protein